MYICVFLYRWIWIHTCRISISRKLQFFSLLFPFFVIDRSDLLTLLVSGEGVLNRGVNHTIRNVLALSVVALACL